MIDLCVCVYAPWAKYCGQYYYEVDNAILKGVVRDIILN